MKLEIRAASYLATLGLLLCLTGCAVAKTSTGEWFTVGVNNSNNVPKLNEAELVSSEQGVDVIKRPGAHYSYSRQDKLKVPETFTLRWKAQGDSETSEKVFKVRANLPKDVLQRLQSTERPVHSLSISFFVVNGQAQIKWTFDRLDGGDAPKRGGGATEIAKGVILPQ
jgi:hypothetical protein